MKTLLPVLVRALCSFAVGCLLVANPQTMTTMIVQVVGGIFVVSGIIQTVNYWMARDGEAGLRSLFPVVGVGSLLLGLLLLMKPGVFVTALMYLLGIFVLGAGCSQLGGLVRMRRIAPLQWWVFVWPIALIAMGLLILIHPMKSASLPFLILGIACIGYGFTDLVYALRLMYYMRQRRREYVDFEVIEDPDPS